MTDFDIVVDSREQLPFWPNLERKGLKTGDYSIKGYENRIAIERKSLADLAGTLGKGHARFRKELERAKNLDYFAVVVEGSRTALERKEWYQSFRCKMHGYVLAKIVDTLDVKYGVHFIFCNGREEAKRVILGKFRAFLKMVEDEKC